MGYLPEWLFASISTSACCVSETHSQHTCFSMLIWEFRLNSKGWVVQIWSLHKIDQSVIELLLEYKVIWIQGLLVSSWWFYVWCVLKVSREQFYKCSLKTFLCVHISVCVRFHVSVPSDFIWKVRVTLTVKVPHRKDSTVLKRWRAPNPWKL